MDRYIILKFGNRRVLLQAPDGASATMTTPVDGRCITFDYSSCEVMGNVTVAYGDPEPSPEDILRETREFQLECDQKIRSALLSAGAIREFGADGPADNVKYLGMTEDGTQYTP